MCLLLEVVVGECHLANELAKKVVMLVVAIGSYFTYKKIDKTRETLVQPDHSDRLNPHRIFSIGNPLNSWCCVRRIVDAHKGK